MRFVTALKGLEPPQASAAASSAATGSGRVGAGGSEARMAARPAVQSLTQPAGAAQARAEPSEAELSGAPLAIDRLRYQLSALHITDGCMLYGGVLAPMTQR